MAQAQNGGRKEATIDWKRVDELLEAGCTGTEIAPHFGIHFETLYDRTAARYGMSWTEYSQKMKQKGDSNLREKQYKKALKGDNVMLVWLGKNRLGQKENQEQISVTPQLLSQYNSLMEQISKAQSTRSALNIADNSINNAEKS